MSGEQRSLFDVQTYRNGRYPGARKSSPTSRDAARSVADRIGRRQVDVLKALVVLRTATADEIAMRLARHPYVVRPRCTELLKRGFITLTGETRETPMGAKAAVLKLTDQGAQYLVDAVHAANSKAS